MHLHKKPPQSEWSSCFKKQNDDKVFRFAVQRESDRSTDCDWPALQWIGKASNYNYVQSFRFRLPTSGPIFFLRYLAFSLPDVQKATSSRAFFLFQTRMHPVRPDGTRMESLRVLFFPRKIEIAGPCGSLRVPYGSLVFQVKCTCGSLRVPVPVDFTPHSVWSHNVESCVTQNGRQNGNSSSNTTWTVVLNVYDGSLPMKSLRTTFHS